MSKLDKMPKLAQIIKFPKMAKNSLKVQKDQNYQKTKMAKMGKMARIIELPKMAKNGLKDQKD